MLIKVLGDVDALDANTAFPIVPVSGSLSNLTPQNNLLSDNSNLPGCPVKEGLLFLSTKPLVDLNLKGRGGNTE